MHLLPITTSVARRRAAIGLLIAAGLLFATLAVRHAAATTSPVAKRIRNPMVATLRERLVYGLQARIPSELAFIDAVVFKVHTGKLPERLVDQTFFWARDRASVARNGGKQRPIVYFQPAMRARAERLNIKL